MGGRGASSGSIGGKSTPDGKFVVGNTYSRYSENAGIDYDFVLTDISDNKIKGFLTDRIGNFGRDYKRGKNIEFEIGSSAYNESKLLKENQKNAKARGNRERKEMNYIRKKLDKAGIKYPGGSGLENLRQRYNMTKRIGKIK